MHKNLGECLLREGKVQEAQDELLTASEMDGGDITLWFKIAGKIENVSKQMMQLEKYSYRMRQFFFTHG